MTVLPIILGALIAILVGAVLGFGLAVLLGANIVSVLLLAVFSAFLVLGSVSEFKRGEKAGDGGFGDVLVGALLLLVAAGSWIGFCFHYI